MINVELKGLKKKVERYKKASEFMEGMVLGYAHMDAFSTIVDFQSSLKKNMYNLKELHPLTIQRKKEMGYKFPRIPLMGKGPSDKKSIYNSLRLEKLPNGSRVFVSEEKHHTANMKMSDLFAIHEHGAIIKVTEKMRGFLHYIGLHLKPTTMVIRIPARPAFSCSVKKGRKEAKSLHKTRIKEMRKAIQIYAETGDTNLIKVITGFRKLGKKFEQV